MLVVRGCKLQRGRAHHMRAGVGITSKVGGLRGGGSLSSTALQLIISRCKVGCEQSIRVSCGNNSHKRVMTDISDTACAVTAAARLAR